MSNNRFVVALAFTLLGLATSGTALSQALPNPYRAVDGWAKLPGGRQIGAVGDVDVDPDGQHIWAVLRCDAGGDKFGYECLDSDLDVIVKFAPDGNAVASFGGGMFIWPHGIDIDAQGNVWVTDAAAVERTTNDAKRRGHQVIKFSPRGEVLLTPRHRRHSGQRQHAFQLAERRGRRAERRRVRRRRTRRQHEQSSGEILERRQVHQSVGDARATRPVEFRTVHAIAIDMRGRVFVGDRSNNRVQIFDQEGMHLATWTQFGQPSGIFFDRNDRIYVADSESDDLQNPGWEMGIRIGDAEKGWIDSFILYQWGDPREPAGNGAEFAAVDSAGNIYAGEPRPRKLQKYVRVRQ